MPSQSSQHAVYRVPETVWGATPATPAFIRKRFDASSLAVERSFTVSREMNIERRKLDGRLGSYNVGGSQGGLLAYGDWDEELEMCLGGTWTGDVLKQGVTRRSATYERFFSGLTAPEYWRFEGSEIDSMSFSTQQADSDVFIGVEAAFVAPRKTLGTAEIAGATYAEPVTNEDPFASFAAVLREDSSVLGIATEFSFELANGLARRPVIGSLETIRPSIAMFDARGSLTAHAEDSSLITKFEGETETSLDIEYTDPAGNKLKFEFPRVKFTSGRADASGEDDILVPLDWEALYDDVAESTVVITRTPAP